MRRVVIVLGLVASLGACSTPRDETWIGRNVGVTVDSRAEEPVEATPPAER